jgi:protein tyrosine phosphatase
MNEITTEKLTVPFDRCYWVIPGQLLAGCYPGDKHAIGAEMKLTGLIHCGIRHVISLMESDERDHSGQSFTSYEDQMESLAKKIKVTVTFDQIPIKDLSIPTERQMIRILNQIDICIKYGKPIYVHCWGGRGRTGTVVGCYLARHGIAVGKDALIKINELRRNIIDEDMPSPETKDQIKMVVDWRAAK